MSQRMKLVDGFIFLEEKAELQRRQHKLAGTGICMKEAAYPQMAIANLLRMLLLCPFACRLMACPGYHCSDGWVKYSSCMADASSTRANHSQRIRPLLRNRLRGCKAQRSWLYVYQSRAGSCGASGYLTSYKWTNFLGVYGQAWLKPRLHVSQSPSLYRLALGLTGGYTINLRTRRQIPVNIKAIDIAKNTHERQQWVHLHHVLPKAYRLGWIKLMSCL